MGVFPAQFPSAASSASLQSGQGTNTVPHMITQMSSQQSTGGADARGNGSGSGSGGGGGGGSTGIGNYLDPNRPPYLTSLASNDLKKYAALPPIPPFRKNRNATNSSNTGQDGSGGDSK